MRELTNIEHRQQHDSMSRQGIANGLIIDYSALANLQADAALGKLNQKSTYRAAGDLYNWNGVSLQSVGIQSYTSQSAFAAAQIVGVAAVGQERTDILVNDSINPIAPFKDKIRATQKATGVLAQFMANQVAVGGSITQSQAASFIDPLAYLIESTVWNKLLELWVPVTASGGTTFNIKLKTAVNNSGVPNYTMTTTAFIGGDCTDYSGLTGDGTSKFLNTGFTPNLFNTFTATANCVQGSGVPTSINVTTQPTFNIVPGMAFTGAASLVGSNAYGIILPYGTNGTTGTGGIGTYAVNTFTFTSGGTGNSTFTFGNCVTGNWGAGIFLASRTNTTGQTLFGTSTGSIFYNLFSGNAYIDQTAINLAYASLVPQLMSLQNNGTTVSSWVAGEQTASAAFTLDGAHKTYQSLQLGSSAGQFSNASIGGYAAWSPVLSSAELVILNDFFNQVSANLGRLVKQNGLYILSDSNGTVVSEGSYTGCNANNIWPQLVANGLGLFCWDNAGNSGSTNAPNPKGANYTGMCMSNNNNTLVSNPVNAAVNWVTGRYTAAATGDSKLCIMCGTNDAGGVVSGGTPVGFYKSDYATTIQALIAQGWRTSNIVLISAVYNPNNYSGTVLDVSLSQYNPIVAALAAQYGCIYVDGYTTMKNAIASYGAAAVIQPVSGLHLTAVGHQILAAAILTAINAQI